MSAHCQVTGRTPGFGNAVSHSHRRTRRRWSPNIQLKTYYLPSEGRRIRLRVSAKGIKVIDRDGIEASQKNGVLRLVLPKAAPAKARKIQLKVAQSTHE